MFEGKLWFAVPVLAAMACMILLVWPRSDSAPPADRGPGREPRTTATRSGEATPPNGEPDADLPGAPPKADGRVAGRVVWPDGTPFKGDCIILSSMPSERGIDTIEIDRSRTGRFLFESIPEGTYRVGAANRLEYSTHYEASFEVETGRDDYVLVIEDRPDRPVLCLRVEGPDGRPVAGATIEIEVMGNYEIPQDRKIEVRDGTAHATLRFPSRRVLLTVYKAVAVDGSRLAEQTLGPLQVTKKTLVVRLDGERPLSGRVIGPDGTGVGGVAICAGLRPPVLTHVVGWGGVGIHDTTVQTDSDGSFRFPGLGKAHYRLAVDPPPAWARPDDIPVAPESAWVEIRLRKGVDPRVRVLDPAGAPVCGCKLYVSEGPLALEEVSTNKDGTAFLRALDPGREYTLQVLPPRHENTKLKGGIDEDWIEDPMRAETGHAPRPLGDRTLRNWLPAETVVRLQYETPAAGERAPPGSAGASGTLRTGEESLRIRIPNWPRPEGGLLVQTGWISCGGDATEQEFLFSPPDFEISHLRADRTYRISIACVGDGLALEAGGLRPGPKWVELKLRPGLRITGRIELPPGTEYAMLRATRGALEVWTSGSAVVHRDGSFEIIGLLPGTWCVQADVRAGEKWYSAECNVQAGTSVRLVPIPD